jgi:hypothetical protein
MRSDLLAAARRLMSRHHAAAIALLGWYLMIPPRDEKGVLQPRRPLRKWNRAASYNTAQECEVGIGPHPYRSRRVGSMSGDVTEASSLVLLICFLLPSEPLVGAAPRRVLVRKTAPFDLRHPPASGFFFPIELLG